VSTVLLDAAGPAADVAALDGVLPGLLELPQAAITSAAAASPAGASHLVLILLLIACPRSH